MNASRENSRILVIDDDEGLRYSLRRVLSGRGFEVLEAGSGEEGVKQAEQTRPQVVLLDNRMDGMSGIETLQHLRGINPNAMVIIMTAYGTTQTTIEAMKFGAFDYITKPFDLKKILDLSESALAAAGDIAKAGPGSTGTAKADSEELESGMIGNSPAMQAVFKMIGQVAASDATVMITGESGTGKELIARAIYRNSLRAKQPYIAVNCAAIPENLIESELFGHEKGAFTGASAQRIGKFEQCDGGTIFLDEIGDMSPPTQTKILRAIQEGEIQRVGGSENIRIDVRVLAATNKPLETMVKEKTFREDLYYRLNVVRIQLPALRERLEDVPDLVKFVLARLARESKTGTKTISPEALDVLSHHDWPGNVRELENLVYRSAVMAQGDTILVKDLPPEVVQSAGASGAFAAAPEAGTGEPDPAAGADDPAEPDSDSRPPFDRIYDELRQSEGGANLLERAEREIIRRALAETGGKTGKAAELLGMTRATLRKRIDQYNLAQ